MTDAVTHTDRESTAAARRRIAAADRARDWRERQREAEAARQVELDALRAEVAELRAQRDRLQSALGRSGAGIDEDLVRALVRIGGLRRDAAGPLVVARPTVAIRDVVAAAALIRCGGKEAGQAAYDAARVWVLERLSQFLLPTCEA